MTARQPPTMDYSSFGDVAPIMGVPALDIDAADTAFAEAADKLT